MANGLSVNRIVNVVVNLQPVAVPRRNFGVLCIAGDTAAIDGLERLRSYSTIEGVGADFGVGDPEYKAAQLYFSQSPKPSILYVGRWVRVATPAQLKGGPPESDIDAWRAIHDGAFTMVVDGEEAHIEGLDFTACATMAAVAEEIGGKLAAVGAACAWDGSRFVVLTTATGKAASLGYATAPAAGTDIGGMAGLTAALAYTPVPGYDAESALTCAQTLADKSGEWYGLTFAAGVMPDTAALVDVAGFIEAAGKARVFGYTVADPRALSTSFATDLFSLLKAKGYDRSLGQYSTSSPYAVCSLLGRAFTVNFNANRSTITLKFKTEPGIMAENLTESEATALAAKNGNVFVNYDNDTAIIQEGKVASGAFFDEVHGLDWLQNAMQTECYNLLYQSKTKIPQTEEGVGQIMATLAAVCEQGVANGLIAPGVWNADGFGQLSTGDYLPKGYYLYSQPIVDQAQSEREGRKCPPIQTAIKMAGAVHFVDVSIDVNR